MSELRTAFVHAVRTAGLSCAQACRQFGVSRKTGFKWLARFEQDPDAPLVNRSRRPLRSPGKTPADLEAAALQLRDRFGWGPRKIAARLRAQGLEPPSPRTLASLLLRNGRIQTTPKTESPNGAFERERPNDLWQLDFKGPCEVARQRVFPLAVIDDHSRFLLALHACTDLTMASAWNVLWAVFGEFGLPRQVLCDNAFGTRGQSPCTVSWFEARLIRLGIDCLHGRPYHPQTQGKVERLNGTLQRELWPRIPRDDLSVFQRELDVWRHTVYNSLRPHQSLGDLPPSTRYKPSPRPRPDRLPELVYPSGADLRKVMNRGDVNWRGHRILVGAGLAGDLVRILEHDAHLQVFYAHKLVRSIPLGQLRKNLIL
jgi:transposase InsO family protein